MNDDFEMTQDVMVDILAAAQSFKQKIYDVLAVEVVEENTALDSVALFELEVASYQTQKNALKQEIEKFIDELNGTIDDAQMLGDMFEDVLIGLEVYLEHDLLFDYNNVANAQTLDANAAFFKAGMISLYQGLLVVLLNVVDNLAFFTAKPNPLAVRVAN